MQRFANASEFEDFRTWSLDLDDERLLALESAQRIELQVEEALQVWHQFGDSTKAPLVLLHGGSGSWTHWIRNVLPLSKERCIYAVDLPGMGDSEVPRGAVDADDVADAIALGMEKLLGRVPVEVMGWEAWSCVSGRCCRGTHLVRVLLYSLYKASCECGMMKGYV